MNIKILASGSDANAYLIESENSSLLLEAGLPYKKLASLLDYNFDKIVGCFLSHSHLDHSKSAAKLAKMGIDVFASPDCLEAIKIPQHHAVSIEVGKNVTAGDFSVIPIELVHDVLCYGYLIKDNTTGEKLVFATDTSEIKYNFKGITYYMIECNYDKFTAQRNSEQSVNSFKYRRLPKSHMEIGDVLQFFLQTDLSKTKKIYLLHISKENGDAQEFVQKVSESTGIETISQED